MATKPKTKKNKKKRNRGLTATDQRSMEQSVRSCIGKGFSDYKILETLGIQPHTLKEYKLRIFDNDQEEFASLNNTKVYTEFVEKARQNVKDLDDMQQRFKFKHQYTALVACIKMKHEINKDVLKVGQQVGFIEQQGNEISVETEMSFSTMSTDDVKKEVAHEVARLNDMAQGGNIIEMRPELLATLEEDEATVKKYIPNEAIVEPIVPKKSKSKIKIKVKLKKRL